MGLSVNFFFAVIYEGQNKSINIFVSRSTSYLATRTTFSAFDLDIKENYYLWVAYDFPDQSADYIPFNGKIFYTWFVPLDHPNY